MSLLAVTKCYDQQQQQRSKSTQPVNNAVPVKEHKCQRDFGSIKTCPLFIKLARSLDLKHEITAVHILHHKEQPILQTVSIICG